MVILELNAGDGALDTMTAVGHDPPRADLERGIGYISSQVDELIGRPHMASGLPGRQFSLVECASLWPLWCPVASG